MDLKEVFDKYADEYMEFDRVENKLHSRPDICAFLLLDKLVPSEGNPMVSVADNSGIYLDTDCEKLAAVATEDDILMLRRCGVRYDSYSEWLMMLV